MKKPPLSTGIVISSILLCQVLQCISIPTIETNAETPEKSTGLLLKLVVIVILVLFGGVFAGLTLGLMSLDPITLRILKTSGTPAEKRYADAIEPIRKKGHLLLVTLLLGNTIVNETLPIIFDSTFQGGGWQAVLASTCLVVIFGEIMPQALCSRYGLQIGAFFARAVGILMWLLFIIAYPIAKFLDILLGESSNGHIYRKGGLKELIHLHGEENSGPLNSDELNIIDGVLELADKTVEAAMTPLPYVFMLSVDDKLDFKLLKQVMKAGHSRIPIYRKTRENIVGVLLVKQLLCYDPDDETSVENIDIRSLPFVEASCSLMRILKTFSEGKSHMAVVVKSIPVNPLQKSNPTEEFNSVSVVGIITMEDVIEELIKGEILDETDVYIDVATKRRVVRAVINRNSNTFRGKKRGFSHCCVTPTTPSFQLNNGLPFSNSPKQSSETTPLLFSQQPVPVSGLHKHKSLSTLSSERIEHSNPTPLFHEFLNPEKSNQSLSCPGP